MAKKVSVSWYYSETNPAYPKLGDVGFYKSLPGMKEFLKGGPPIGGPDFNPIILMGGTAILSSSVLAAAIKAYVAYTKRRVVISIGDKKLEYEGPNLKEDQKIIEEMIDKLSDKSGTTSFTIYAEEKRD